MLRAALVDVGGTLWPDRRPIAAKAVYAERLVERFHLAPAEVDRLLHELEMRDPASAHPTPLVQDSWKMADDALQATGLERIPATRLLEAMDVPAAGMINLFPGAKSLLERLRALGLRCAVISNATFRTSAGYRRDFRSFSLEGLIEEVISSVDLGVRKPSKRFFDAAVRAAGCPASHCVVIGDSEEKDVVPALERGMRVIRVAIETPPPEASGAHAVATSLREAADIVTRWSQSA